MAVYMMQPPVRWHHNNVKLRINI